MSSYLFHHQDADSDFIAPAPPEYALFTQERAVWTALGKRKNEMTAHDFYRASLFLRLEAADRKKRQG